MQMGPYLLVGSLSSLDTLFCVLHLIFASLLGVCLGVSCQHGLPVLQVREQERCIALQIRKEVQRRRDRELQNLADQLQEEWQRQQREKLQALEKLYQDSLNTLGEGHRNAKENASSRDARQICFRPLSHVINTCS